MVTWGGVLHPIWNSVAVLVWLVAVIVVVRIPTDRFTTGWRSKAWWVLCTGVAVYAAGFYLPAGAIVGVMAVARHRQLPLQVLQ